MNLTGAERRIRRDDLIASRDNCHSRLAHKHHLPNPKGQQAANILRAKAGASRQYFGIRRDVLADLDHVLPASHGTPNLDFVGKLSWIQATDDLGVLNLDDRIGRVRQHPSRVDDNGLPRIQDVTGRPAHRDLANDLQQRRQAFARPMGIGSADRIPVHRAAPKGRQRMGRYDCIVRDAPQRSERRQCFRVPKRANVLQEKAAGLVGRQDVEKLGHGSPDRHLIKNEGS